MSFVSLAQDIQLRNTEHTDDNSRKIVRPEVGAFVSVRFRYGSATWPESDGFWGLVDTGALHLVIPQNVPEALDAPITEEEAGGDAVGREIRLGKTRLDVTIAIPGGAEVTRQMFVKVALGQKSNRCLVGLQALFYFDLDFHFFAKKGTWGFAHFASQSLPHRNKNQALLVTPGSYTSTWALCVNKYSRTGELDSDQA